MPFYVSIVNTPVGKQQACTRTEQLSTWATPFELLPSGPASWFDQHHPLVPVVRWPGRSRNKADDIEHCAVDIEHCAIDIEQLT